MRPHSSSSFSSSTASTASAASATTTSSGAYTIRGRTTRRHRGALARDSSLALARLNRTVDKSLRESEVLAQLQERRAGGGNQNHAISREDADLSASKEHAKHALYETRRKTQFNH